MVRVPDCMGIDVLQLLIRGAGRGSPVLWAVPCLAGALLGWVSRSVPCGLG